MFNGVKVLKKTQKELEAMREFVKSQKQKYPENKDINRFEYIESTNNGIGRALSVLDRHTGEIKDITDYEVW